LQTNWPKLIFKNIGRTQIAIFALWGPTKQYFGEEKDRLRLFLFMCFCFVSHSFVVWLALLQAVLVRNCIP